jgi:hypothetical protein
MAQYGTIETVKDFGVMLPEDVDAIESRYPGLVLRRLELASAHIDARLPKRYATPFVEPYPHKVIGWAAVITSYQMLVDLQGVNPESSQHVSPKERYDEALAEVKEAADAKDGLFELPLRQEDPRGATAINVGGPLSYSEQSPYTWMRRQRERARSEGR